MLGTTPPIPFTINGKQASSFASLMHAHPGDTIAETTTDPGLVGLMKLGDVSSWSADGYHPPAQLPGYNDGIGAMDTTLDGQRVSFDADFKTNCTNGFGTAPAAAK